MKSSTNSTQIFCGFELSFPRKFYCLPQGTSKRGRQSANQSVRQASSQAGSQSGKQAGRQAGRNTQFGFFFSCGLRLQTLGNHWYAGTISGRVVEHPDGGSPRADFIPSQQFGDRQLSPSIDLEPLLYSTLVGGHSRRIPQGMVLDVQPLVKSLFCPTKQSPNGFFDFETSIP